MERSKALDKIWFLLTKEETWTLAAYRLSGYFDGTTVLMGKAAYDRILSYELELLNKYQPNYNEPNYRNDSSRQRLWDHIAYPGGLSEVLKDARSKFYKARGTEDSNE